MRDNEMKNAKTNKRKQTIDRLLFPKKNPNNITGYHIQKYDIKEK